MQVDSVDVLDVGKESQSTREFYVLDKHRMMGMGFRCLMARLLVESGVG